LQGFPTIKIFGLDKKKPEDYQGERSAKGLVTGAMAAAQKFVQARLGGKSGGGGGGEWRGGRGTGARSVTRGHAQAAAATLTRGPGRGRTWWS
jgi:protein disulfide-isomerase A6